jgi:hypothetical protein
MLAGIRTCRGPPVFCHQCLVSAIPSHLPGNIHPTPPGGGGGQPGGGDSCRDLKERKPCRNSKAVCAWCEGKYGNSMCVDEVSHAPPLVKGAWKAGRRLRS